MSEATPPYAELFYQPTETVQSVWGLTKRQRKLLLYGTFGGAGLYFLYRAYKSDTLQALIELRTQFEDGLEGFGKTFKLSSEISRTVVSDLHSFLNSDDDQIPQSLRQLTKLANSEEASQLVSNLAASVANGLFQATGGNKSHSDSSEAHPDFLERILTALSTEKGTNLVSLAVSMACRSCVQAYCEFGGSSGVSGPNFWQQLLDYGTTPLGERLYSSCVGAFAREGTKVYMGSLEGVSGWDDLLNNLCKPERALAMDRMTRSFVNELVVSYFRRARYGLRQDIKNGKTTHSKDKMGQPLISGASAYPAEVRERRASANDLATSDQSLQPTASTADWTKALVQISKHTEVRNLVLSLAKTATSEGVRSSMLTARDLLKGSAKSVSPSDLQTMSTKNLGTLLLMVFLPILLFLAGRRSCIA